MNLPSGRRGAWSNAEPNGSWFPNQSSWDYWREREICRSKGRFPKSIRRSYLVVIGHRRKGGVSKNRIAEILKLDPSPLLDELLAQELVYCDPREKLNFWRATQSALLALGLRSSSDIPALKELEEWFEALSNKSVPQANWHLPLERNKKPHSRRLKRELERRQSVGPFPGTASLPVEEIIPGQEGESDSFGVI